MIVPLCYYRGDPLPRVNPKCLKSYHWKVKTFVVVQENEIISSVCQVVVNNTAISARILN